MKTVEERLRSLEAEVVELRSALSVAGAAIIFPLQEAIDQLVDERILSAATRTAIWARVRKQAEIVGAGNRSISHGMTSAIPRYATPDQRKEATEMVNRIRKAQLQPRPKKPDAGR